MKDFVELRHILRVIGARPWFLISLTVIAALAGLLYSRSQTPIYQATTTLLVGQFMQSSSVNRTDIQTSGDVARSYADIALRQPVLDQVVQKLKLDETWQELKKAMRVRAIEGTQLIEVTAEATSPATARAIADEVARQLIQLSPTATETADSEANYDFMRKQLASLKQRLTDAQNRIDAIDASIEITTSKTALAQLQQEKTALEQSITEWEKTYVSLSELAKQVGGSNNYLTVIEPAQSTKDPVRPRVVLDTLIAAGVGLVLALGLVFLRDYLDSSVHSVEQLEELLGLTPLAVIGTIRRSGWRVPRALRTSIRGVLPVVGGANRGVEMAEGALITLEHPASAESESFRTLRTNIQFASVAKPLRSLVVTSAAPMEGKSFVAANLAVAMAQIGKKVILVDGDLRRPSLHTIFGLPNSRGLTNLILAGTAPGALQRIFNVPNLMVFTSGPLPANPSELLNSDRVTQVMAYLVEHADLVIYDSPPASMVTDAAILGTRADGVILVARAAATRRDLILRAKQALQNVGVTVILPVLNGVALEDTGMYQGYYRQFHNPPAEPDQAPLDKQETQPANKYSFEAHIEALDSNWHEPKGEHKATEKSGPKEA